MEFIIVVALFVLPVVFWNKVYFKPVSAVYLSSDHHDPVLVSVKPSGKWFRSIAAGKRCGQVHLGGGFYAFYCESEVYDYSCSKVIFPSEIYIFARGRFGRFKSVDLSSRVFVDVLNKFKK